MMTGLLAMLIFSELLAVIAIDRPFTGTVKVEPAPLADVLAKLSPVDLVIVEGFKRHAHPKIEIFRAAVGKPLLHPEDDCIVAIATDAPLPQAQLPVLMLDDIAGIADAMQAEALPRDRIGRPSVPEAQA